MALTSRIVGKLGNAVKKVAKNKTSSWWYTPEMAAASQAVAHRIPLVDFVLEVRDARIPLSSAYEGVRNFLASSRHIILLNKMDLANHVQLKEWMGYFEQRNSMCFSVNAHNKESIRELLNFLQARVRELMRAEHSRHTITYMLVGIPNVGKSALANSLHQIGRISAAEKGKLKHAVVSPQPGETKSISSLKIASHPNIYLLDTPSVLPPEIIDAEVCCKLALTGAIRDSVFWDTEIAQYFLAILNLDDQYKKWEKLSADKNDRLSSIDPETVMFSSSESGNKKKRQYSTDHTQDFVVKNVRRTLFETISSFDGNLKNEEDLEQLIEREFRLLTDAFYINPELVEEKRKVIVATKLINLYRTGRLGHYVLDSFS